MEKEIGMETALFGGPPELGNMVKLATGQINFMSIFALPLFEGVADLCPQMVFACQQIQSNRSIWQDVSERQKRRNRLLSETDEDRTRSPQSISPQKTEQREVSVSQVQENVVAGGEAVSAKVTLDPPPDTLVDAPSPSAQKKLADKQIDLSLTTFSGFQTSTESSDVTTHSSETRSVTAGNSKALELPDTNFPTHDETHDNWKTSPSGQISRPSSSYGVGRDTRTQSASTCTNTVATPVSPATNATSFVSLDSGDGRDANDSGQSSTSDVNDTTEDENHSRPSSSGLYAVSDYQRPQTNGHYLSRQPQPSHRIDDIGKSHHIMTAILRNGMGSRGSSSVDDETPKAQSPGPQQDVISPSLPLPTLVRKKSRMRLAFWKRRSSYQR
jgi:3',5'-cyclic-nucleotide phosphodiesterase